MAMSSLGIGGLAGTGVLAEYARPGLGVYGFSGPSDRFVQMHYNAKCSLDALGA